jgi:Uma2 family endonuclease
MNTVTLNLEPIIHLTDEQFYLLCMGNKDLNLEQNATGELIIVPPVGGESGNQDEQVEIYRSGQPVQVVQTPSLLSGEEVLPGFQLQI